MKMSTKNLTPGAYFYKTYLANRPDLPKNQLANYLDMTLQTLDQFLQGKVNCGVEISVRIAKLTDTNPKFWLEMQFECDVEASYEVWNRFLKDPISKGCCQNWHLCRQ